MYELRFKLLTKESKLYTSTTKTQVFHVKLYAKIILTTKDTYALPNRKQRRT